MRPFSRFFNQRTLALIAVFGVLQSISALSQTFTTLVVFNGTNGATPVDTPLVQGLDGNLYGTTLGGGVGGNDQGTVFRITPAGKLTTVYSFCSKTNCADGSQPYGGLVLGTDGNFYGTSSQGGADGISGTIFKITPSGTLTTLHSFNGADGAGSAAPMILARDGDFYGITENGGSNNSGTVFKISPQAAFTSLHSFVSGEGFDSTGPLMQASDGNFYSTTELGGANGYGSIFKITPAGAYSTFYSFSSIDGSAPAGGLIQATDGELYGTTYQGGAFNTCENGCGTVFMISLAGVLTTVANLESTGPANPIAGLIQATDGNFYGSSYAGGISGDWGTVFEVAPSGSVTILHSFDGNDGAQPYGPLTQDTNGYLYGTATNGLGTDAQGTVFRETTRLVPFVSLIQSTGKAGQTVGVLGQNFSSVTNVSFNGTEAPFTIRSGTLVVATVPAGASSGFVEVKTASGAMKSNVPFHVVK
jgi:uncharacterized repeat protein (TIGR03803 family)